MRGAWHGKFQHTFFSCFASYCLYCDWNLQINAESFAQTECYDGLKIEAKEAHCMALWSRVKCLPSEKPVCCTYRRSLLIKSWSEDDFGPSLKQNFPVEGHFFNANQQQREEGKDFLRSDNWDVSSHKLVCADTWAQTTCMWNYVASWASARGIDVLAKYSVSRLKMLMIQSQPLGRTDGVF